MPSNAHTVFVSHAAVNKASTTLELVQHLRSEGLTILYAGDGLLPGQDIPQWVNGSIGQSWFAAVVPPQFLTANYALQELGSLLNLYNQQQIGIIPLLQGMSFDNVHERCALLPSILSLSSKVGAEVKAQRIAKACN